MKILLILVAILCNATSALARSDIVDGVNRIRRRGCETHAGIDTPLRPSIGLDVVAREWSNGGRLRDALERADYRAVNSTSIHIQGATDANARLEVLARSYCKVILDRSFIQIGAFQSGQHLWVILATPFAAPSPGKMPEVGRQVLTLVNEARAKARRCGGTTYPAVKPLELSAALSSAALAHAKDMAVHDFFEHEGSDGSRPSERISRTGYRWRAAGENIALGQRDAKGVVESWLDSPHHCVNIMSAQFSQMGVAYFVDRNSSGGIYWSQVFAAPQ